VVHGDGGGALDASRAAGQHDERRFLGIRAGHGVDHVEPSGAVGDAAGAEAAGDAGRAVGGEAHRRFVAQTNETKSSVPFERFIEVEDEVAGDPEDVADAVLPQTVEEELMEARYSSSSPQGDGCGPGTMPAISGSSPSAAGVPVAAVRLFSSARRFAFCSRFSCRAR